MARPKKGSGGRQKIGQAKPREDLDLGSDQNLDKPEEEEEVEKETTHHDSAGEQLDKIINPEEREDDSYKGNVDEDAKTDQEIINKNTESGGIGAPAIVKELTKSIPPKPPESQDIEYLTQEEISLGDRINTLTTVLIEYPNAPSDHQGPFIQRCVGRNPETHKLQVVMIPAKEIQIIPNQVMQYLGSVIRDHQSVHTANVVYQRVRWGYCFDTFYVHNGKRLARCCYVPNRTHQAGLLYEKMVDRKTRKAFARIKQMKGEMGKGTGEPMYMLVGAKEADYRDLKKLYERYFLRRGEEQLAEDIGLKVLIQGAT